MNTTEATCPPGGEAFDSVSLFMSLEYQPDTTQHISRSDDHPTARLYQALATSAGPLFMPERGTPITGTWITNYQGTAYVLDHHGRLQPTQRIGAEMSTAHLEQARQDRHRSVTRAVHEELRALAARRAEQQAATR